MLADQFRSALRLRPFQPFAIRTASGAEYAITHPEQANITDSGRTVVVLEGGEFVVVIDTASITEYLVLPKPPRKKSSRK